MKDAAFVKHKQESQVEHGKSLSQIAGVRNYRAQTQDERAVAPSTIYTTEHGAVKLYDSTVRVVDSQYFDKEMGEAIEREKDLEDLAFKLLKAGDQMAMRILGSFWGLLGQVTDTGRINTLKSWIKLDGYDETQTEYIIEKIKRVDCRPSSMKIYPEASEQYSEAIYKLLFVLRFCGLVFTNKKTHINPDPTVPSGARLFDPRNDTTPNSANDVINRMGGVNLFNTIE
jgi:hypothetical protein